MAYVTANNGPDAGGRYELSDKPSILGRHPDCEIVVDAGAVSRQHAQICADGTSFYIEDLQSRNGTYVNDQMIEGRRVLTDGDQLRVCDVAFTFHGGERGQLGDVTKDESTKTVNANPRETILIDDDGDSSGSTIMSKLDVLSSHGRIQLTASPEVKLDALIEITQALAKALSLDEVLPGVLNSLFKIFVQADRGFIVMRRDDELVPMWTKVRRPDSDSTLRISRTIVRQVMETKEAILSADAASDERFEMSQSIADFRIRSMMCAPLLDSEGNALGVLQIDTLDQRKRFQQQDLEVLASVASQAGIGIDNARLHDESLKQIELQRDLEVAHEVQRGFLPDKPPALDGYQFFNYYEPANHVGGDYFDYITLPDGRVAIIVADVVGHGIAAALLMAKMASEARYCLASESDVGAATVRLNEAITGLNLDRFITMVLAVLDPETHEVTVANAGHMAPLYRLQDGSLEEPGEHLAGVPLGIMSGMEYNTCTFTVSPGESFTMYTDGINECSNPDGDMYGIDRLREHIRQRSNGSLDSLGKIIIDDVRSYLGGRPQDDDMCLVCVGRR